MAEYRVRHITWIPSYPAEVATLELVVMMGIAPSDYEVGSCVASMPFNDVIAPIFVYRQEGDAIVL